MAMNEIVIIDNDDLEEGEIADDVAHEVVKPEEKSKELPLRYKVSNGWQKNYKYKEKNKFQNSSKSEVIHRKKHKSSCRHNSDKHKLKYRGVRDNHYSSVIKSAFKNYTSPPRVPPIPKKVSSNLQSSENAVNFQNLLLDYRKAKERLNQKVEKPQNNQDNFQKNELVNNSRKANIVPAKSELINTLSIKDKPEVKIGAESEEEDVEELRRIALATRAKKQSVSKADAESSNEVPNSNSNNPPNKVSLNNLVEALHGECDNDSRDNYEVVDMDLEEEEGDSCKIVNDDSLFIIDKMPAVSEFSQNLSNGYLIQSNENQTSPEENKTHLLSNHSIPIDDFEEQLLRAEVIASMNLTRQKPQSAIDFRTPVEEKMSEIVAKVDMIHSAVNAFHNERKPNPCAIYSKGPLQNSVKQPPKRIIDAKSKFSNLKKNKMTASPLPLRGMNTIQERLIITVSNDDSSTDESEEEKNENAASPNVPVSSIEALISNARQKSDAAQLNNGSSANVSCLSKAQQEEYNSLKKLLAEKTQFSVPAPITKEKNPVDKSHINLLIKKISVAKTNLEKEVGIRSQIEKELIKEKKNYIASKLRVQMLKEKLHAAEKIRAANLENWKQCSARLDVVRKSVSKRESLLKLLETELNTKNTCIESISNTPPV